MKVVGCKSYGISVCCIPLYNLFPIEGYVDGKNNMSIIYPGDYGRNEMLIPNG